MKRRVIHWIIMLALSETNGVLWAILAPTQPKSIIGTVIGCLFITTAAHLNIKKEL